MNWKHSFYEIYAMTFGQAFTIDEAHRLLSEQREDRLFSIASAFAESKRAQAKVIDAKMSIRDHEASPPKETKANARRAEAGILETEARFIIARPCLDMARAELEFIESLLEYIDGNRLRIHPDPTVGYQLVQEMEIGFDYLWQLIYDGPSSALMRNIFAHPRAEELLASVPVPNTSFPSRKAISDRLSQIYGLQPSQLAITVNVFEQIKTITHGETLSQYRTSAKTAMNSLQEKVIANSPGNSASSVGIESAD